MPSDPVATNKLKTAAVALLVVLLLVTAAGLAVIYSGLIDIAATRPHYAVTSWILQTTMEHSVERRAEAISPPPAYHAGSKTMHHYKEMCELCHGGPGK